MKIDVGLFEDSQQAKEAMLFQFTAASRWLDLKKCERYPDTGFDVAFYLTPDVGEDSGLIDVYVIYSNAFVRLNKYGANSVEDVADDIRMVERIVFGEQ